MGVRFVFSGRSINQHALSHYKKKPPCEDCKGKQQAGKYPPRDNMVRYVDKASSVLEDDIDACRIDPVTLILFDDLLIEVLDRCAGHNVILDTRQRVAAGASGHLLGGSDVHSGCPNGQRFPCPRR